MKHSTQDLILAAHVRDLIAIRLSKDAPKDVSDEARQAWIAEHAAAYTQSAIEELITTADRIAAALSNLGYRAAAAPTPQAAQ